MIRIVDEAVRTDAEQQQAWELQEQMAAAAALAQAAQMDQAMRLAAQGNRATASESADAGPLFVSPRAEVPEQRTLFTAQAPQFEEAGVEEEVASGKSLFNRIANSFAGSSRTAAAPNPRATAQASMAVERKAEVRETVPATGEEEEFYDIPAFLRRQAN